MESMEYLKTEEKSPLLLYVMESEANVSKNNKRVNFDKGRLYGISSGATTVFTEFPNYISPCWLTAILSGLIFFMMLLLTISSISPSHSSRLPRCVGSHFEKIDNKTIHLVHDRPNWNLQKLKLLEAIKNEYPEYHVHVLELKHGVHSDPSIFANPRTEYHSEGTTKPSFPSLTTTVRRNKRNSRNITHLLMRKRDQETKAAPFLGVKSLLDILLNSRLGNGLNSKRNANETITVLQITTPAVTKADLTFESVTENFPNLTIEKVNVEEAFTNTPLEKYWIKFNPALIIFSMRVLRLWEFGGLTFKFNDIDEIENPNDVDSFSIAPRIGLTVTPSVNVKLMNFIKSGKLIFEKLPEEMVTADDESYHMFTKMPCHAFFAEVILTLKRAYGDESVKKIVQKSLKFFCERSSMARKYCKNFIRKRG